MIQVVRSDWGTTAFMGPDDAKEIAKDILLMATLGLNETILLKYNATEAYHSNIRGWTIDDEIGL